MRTPLPSTTSVGKPEPLAAHGPDVPPLFYVAWTLYTQTAGAYGRGGASLGSSRVALLLSRN